MAAPAARSASPLNLRESFSSALAIGMAQREIGRVSTTLPSSPASLTMPRYLFSYLELFSFIGDGTPQNPGGDFSMHCWIEATTAEEETSSN